MTEGCLAETIVVFFAFATRSHRSPWSILDGRGQRRQRPVSGRAQPSGESRLWSVDEYHALIFHEKVLPPRFDFQELDDYRWITLRI